MTQLDLAQLAARIHVNSTATLSPKGISNANGICCSPSTTGSPSTKGWPASEISPQQSQYRDRGQLTSQAAATGNREIDGAAGQRKRTATGSVPKATGIVNNAFPIVRVALTKHNQGFDVFDILSTAFHALSNGACSVLLWPIVEGNFSTANQMLPLNLF